MSKGAMPLPGFQSALLLILLSTATASQLTWQAAGYQGRKLLQGSAGEAGIPLAMLVVRLKAVSTLCLDFRTGAKLQVAQLYNCDAVLGMSQAVQTQQDTTNPDLIKLIVRQNLDKEDKTRILEITIPFKQDQPEFTSVASANGVPLIAWDLGTSEWRGSPAKSFIQSTATDGASYQLRMSLQTVSKCLGVVGGDGAGSLYLGTLDCDPSDLRQTFMTASGVTNYLSGQRVLLRAAAAPTMCWDTGDGGAGSQLTLAKCEFFKDSQLFTIQIDTAAPGQVTFTQQGSGSTRLLSASGNSFVLVDDSGSVAPEQSFTLDATADTAMGFKVRTSPADTSTTCVGVTVSEAGLSLGPKECGHDLATVFGISSVPDTDLSWLPTPGRGGAQWDPAALVDNSLPAATFTQPGVTGFDSINVTVRLMAAPNLCWDMRVGALLQNVNLLRCDGSDSQLFMLSPTSEGNGWYRILEQASGNARSLVVVNPANTSEPAASVFNVDGLSVAVWDPAQDTQYTSQDLVTNTQSFQLQPAGVAGGYLIVSKVSPGRCVGVVGVTNTGVLLQGLLPCRQRDPRQVFRVAGDTVGNLLTSVSNVKGLLSGETLHIRSSQYADRCWDAGSAAAGAPVTLQPCEPGKSSQTFAAALDLSNALLLSEQASGSNRRVQLSPTGQLLVAPDQDQGTGLDLLMADGGYQLCRADLCVSVTSFSPPGADGIPLGLQERNNGRNVSKIFTIASSQASGLSWVSRQLVAAPIPTPPTPGPVPAPSPGDRSGLTGQITPSPGTPSSPGSNKSGLSSAAIIGIIVGAVVLLLLLLLLIILLLCKRRKAHKPGTELTNLVLGGAGAGPLETKTSLARSDSSLYPYTPTATTGTTAGSRARKELTDISHKPLPSDTSSRMASLYGVPEDFVNRLAPYFAWLQDAIPGAVAVEEGISAAWLHGQAQAAAHGRVLAASQLPPADAPGPMPVELTAKEVQEQVELLPSGLLGSGGSALVFKGRWQRIFGPQAYVAVKVLRNPKHPLIQRLIEAIRHEVAVLTNCRHANIVRIYGYCLQEPNMCIIMELLSHTLSKRIHEVAGPVMPAAFAAGPPASVVEVIQVSKQIAEGLAFLHTRQDVPKGVVAATGEGQVYTHVLHRDLKPANVLIDSRGTAKLVDFGLAREVDATTLHTIHPGDGTPSFMAPEVLLPRAHITDRADVFSLGCILWQLGNTRLPPNEVDKLRRHLAAAGQAQGRAPSFDSKRYSPTGGDADTGCTLLDLWPAFAALASHCKQDNYRDRPSAVQCVEMLTEMLKIVSQ